MVTKIDKVTAVFQENEFLLNSLLEPISKNQESCIKGNRSFYLFHCKDLTPRQRGSCSFGVCCVYTNIPQEEGIGVVCHYGEHYQSKSPMPTSFLGELMRLIQFWKNNSFKLTTLSGNSRNRYGHQNGRSFRSHFYGSYRKQLFLASGGTSRSSGKDLSRTYFQRGVFVSEKSTTLSILVICSTLLSNSGMKCHLKKLFSLTVKFSRTAVHA